MTSFLGNFLLRPLSNPASLPFMTKGRMGELCAVAEVDRETVSKIAQIQASIEAYDLDSLLARMHHEMAPILAGTRLGQALGATAALTQCIHMIRVGWYVSQAPDFSKDFSALRLDGKSFAAELPIILPTACDMPLGLVMKEAGEMVIQKARHDRMNVTSPQWIPNWRNRYGIVAPRSRSAVGA